DIGGAARAPFQPDPDLPRGFPKVASGVYTGSGFDRGHMCPAKDGSATQEDCNATFFTTNIVPQSPASNQRGWERLEDYCRRLAHEGHVLYVACGPAGVGGTGTAGRREEVGKGRLKVTVPHKLGKVVVVLPREGAEPRKNTVGEALRKAARGLLLPSEADAPVKPFLWEGAGGKLSKDRVRDLAGAGGDTPVEETSLDALFEAVPDEDRPQFDKLAEAIRQ